MNFGLCPKRGNVILKLASIAYPGHSPHWVGIRFPQESADWIVDFLDVARRDYGLNINWISAAQNENGTDLSWVANKLRPTLDAHGFSKVKLQAPDDDSEYW